MTKAEGQDRYLDSSRILRGLEEAERNHQLDAQGVLDELAKAVAHCDRKFEYHSEAADAYMLARAAFFAEAKRRTSLSGPERAYRSNALRNGRPDPVAKEGFRPFCARVGISKQMGHRLAAIGASPDPKSALATHRAKGKAKQAKYHKIRHLDKIIDPLILIKKAWFALSPVQRTEFLRWAVDGGEPVKATKPANRGAAQYEARA